jgi:arsenite-transporting ATPase
MGQSDLAAKLQKWRESIRLVQTQLQDAAKTCFVCVCIPEFLSVYETDRLVLELSKHRISCAHVVVNQLVMRPAAEQPCRMCTSRQKIQGKYLAQIDELFGEDFHVVRMPLHTEEVRGLEALRRFGQFLVTPYNVEVHGYI